jgi:hypothetical protein
VFAQFGPHPDNEARPSVGEATPEPATCDPPRSGQSARVAETSPYQVSRVMYIHKSTVHQTNVLDEPNDV